MQPGRNYVAAHKVEPSPEESPPCWAAKVFQGQLVFIRWPSSGVWLSVGQNFTAYVHHICARVCRRNFSAKPRRAEIPDTRYAIHIADIANERAYDHCNKLQRLLSAASAPGGRHLRLLLKIVQQENLKTMPPNPSQPATAPQTPGHRPKGHGNN